MPIVRSWRGMMRDVVVVRFSRAVQGLVDGMLGDGVVRQGVDVGGGVVVDGVGRVGQGVVRDGSGTGAVAVVT